MKRTATSSKQATHDRIVDAAARAIRRSGYNGTGVADIMKEAGLTHGGFYAHFASRDAMLAEAADRAAGESVAMMERIAASLPPDQALPAMLEAYLSKPHLQQVETGCATAALASEMPRQTAEVRRARAGDGHHRDHGRYPRPGARGRRRRPVRCAAPRRAEAADPHPFLIRHLAGSFLSRTDMTLIIHRSLP